MKTVAENQESDPEDSGGAETHPELAAELRHLAGVEHSFSMRRTVANGGYWTRREGRKAQTLSQTIKARATRDEKALVKRAARRVHMSEAAFVRAAAVRTAVALFEADEEWTG